MQRNMKYRQHVGPSILSHDVRINQFMYRDTSSETRTSALSSTLNHRERSPGHHKILDTSLVPSALSLLLLLVAVILLRTMHLRTLMVKKRTAGKRSPNPARPCRPGPAGRVRRLRSGARRRAGDASVEARALGPPQRLHSSSF